MAPGQIPRPTRQPNHPSMSRPNQQPRNEGMRVLSPKANQALLFHINPQHNFWLSYTKDRFHRLILFGERQPSNGTVRKIERPNGEDRFAVAYGSEPDDDLHVMLENIYARHGEVVLQHNGRDSTGKHWIKCFSILKMGSFERPTERAIICVSSKLQLATIPRHWTWEISGKGKENASRYGNEWPPKVPGAVEGAPEHLYVLPESERLPWLEPAAATALRRKMEVEEWHREFMRRQAQRVRRG